MKITNLLYSKGINISDQRGFLGKPNFKDVSDNLNIYSDAVLGDNMPIRTDTVTGPSGAHRWAQSFTFSLLSRFEQRYLFEQQAWAMGRTRSFWMPSWRMDFNLLESVSPNSGNRLRVLPTDFQFVWQPNRYGVLLEASNGLSAMWLTTGYDEETGLLYLFDDFDFSIPLDQISLCSLVRLCRFDQDTFEWEHITDNKSEVVLRFQEVSA